ncbi:germination lipoprotein GerS-related protein [Defluviitalea saccharophila]|uniref:Germination lipoprotein GerS-related protein n=1 Tax=Defluviitalea saccharophila TaxID=879970 RepID=A0ABZ2YAY2_9FIRM|nr:outer membrane lipoprotein carrier protein LolA [Candidatus Epulonipiscium sp.]
MKKSGAVFFVSIFIVICIIFSACSTKEKSKSPMEKIQEKLTTMESYACIADLTYVSNKGKNTYRTKQYYKMSGEYRIEITAPEQVKGLVTVFDGKKVMQYNPRILGEAVNEIPESKNTYEIFLGTFLKNYLQSEDVTLEVFNNNNEEYTVLEAVIPEGGKYLATEKLWVSNKTLNPAQLVIYDTEGKERIIVKYGDFKYNVNLDDTIFQLKPSEKKE